MVWLQFFTWQTMLCMNQLGCGLLLSCLSLSLEAQVLLLHFEHQLFGGSSLLSCFAVLSFAVFPHAHQESIARLLWH